MDRDLDIVNAAVTAAEDVVFSRYSRSEVADLDVTVHVDEWTIEIDVYVSIPDAPDETEVADDAARAAQAAADAFFDD